MAASGKTIDNPIDGDKWKNTRLHKATRALNEIEVKQLLEAGASPDVKNASSDTPLHEIASLSNWTGSFKPGEEQKAISIAEVLIKAKANTDLENRTNYTPLMEAASSRIQSVDLFTLFVETASNVNLKATLLKVVKVKNLNAFTKILSACSKNQLEFVASALLIELTSLHGKYLEIEHLYLTPLFVQLKTLRKSILKTILETLDPNTGDSILHRALSSANRLNSKMLQEILLAFQTAEASVDIPNRYGMSPLCCLLELAAIAPEIELSENFYQTVQDLLEQGASTTNPNPHLSPLALTQRKGYDVPKRIKDLIQAATPTPTDAKKAITQLASPSGLPPTAADTTTFFSGNAKDQKGTAPSATAPKGKTFGMF